MKLSLALLLSIILGLVVCIETRPTTNGSRIDESLLSEPVMGFNARMGYDKVPYPWGTVHTSKEKGMKNKNPIDDLAEDLVEMSFEKLIKERIEYFTLISWKITNLEKYLGFNASKEVLTINQTKGDVEVQRQKLTMDLLAALTTLEHSGSFVQLLSHERLNPTIRDKLKPALSNLRIKVDRLKAFNEEDIQNVAKNMSTMKEETKKMRAKEAENRANETLGAAFALGQNLHEPTSERIIEDIKIQAKISSTIIPNINSSTMTEETKKMRVKKIENGANKTTIFSKQSSVGSSTTLPQILPAYVNDSELPLTNISDTNGNQKKNDHNSARNSSMQNVVITATVLGGLVVLCGGLVAYVFWKRSSSAKYELENTNKNDTADYCNA